MSSRSLSPYILKPYYSLLLLPAILGDVGLESEYEPDGEPHIKHRLELIMSLENLPFGAIVGVGCLIEVVYIYDYDKANTFNLFDDPFAWGPYCWIIENIQKLKEPIFCKGFHRLWDLDEDTYDELNMML